MARPIDFEAPRQDPRAILMHRLERAPADHAAALLDAYELLQALHDRKVIDTLRGLVGSGETVIDIGVKAAKAPESIHALRNLLVLYNMIGCIDPEAMKKFAGPVPQALQVATLQTDPPSVWRLTRSSIFNRDFRRGLGAMIGLLRAVGVGLRSPAPELPTEPEGR